MIPDICHQFWKRIWRASDSSSLYPMIIDLTVPKAELFVYLVYLIFFSTFFWCFKILPHNLVMDEWNNADGVSGSWNYSIKCFLLIKPWWIIILNHEVDRQHRWVIKVWCVILRNYKHCKRINLQIFWMDFLSEFYWKMPT